MDTPISFEALEALLNETHYRAIGKVASNWAALEILVGSALWRLARVDDQSGACLTAQIPNMARRLDALVALVRLCGGAAATVKKLQKFCEDTHGLQEQRNRVVHDPWHIDRETGELQRLEISTKGGVLKLGHMTMSVAEIEHVVDLIGCHRLCYKMVTKRARRSKKLPTIFTIGHSTRPIAEFLALLQEVGVDLLVDVRSIPRSRTNPQFNADALPGPLGDAGIRYRHLSALGGLRHRKKGAPASPNTFWHVAAFRNYADYAATDAFRTGLNELRALSRDNCCAIMCAEAVWWRCHRRIIADYLLAQGAPVMHIMGSGKVDPAKLTPGAHVLTNGTLVYPAAEEAIKANG